MMRTILTMALLFALGCDSGTPMERTSLSVGQLTTVETTGPQVVPCRARGATSTDGFQMHRVVKVGRDRCEWRRDRLSEREIARMDRERADLFRALKTRVLNDDELRRVAEYGTSLNIGRGPFYADQKLAELQTALQMQLILRLQKAEAKP